MVGHSKTVLIMVGGIMLFGESMPIKKLAGVLLALGGIIWYSWLRTGAVSPANTSLKEPEANSLMSSSPSNLGCAAPSSNLNKTAALEGKTAMPAAATC